MLYRYKTIFPFSTGLYNSNIAMLLLANAYVIIMDITLYKNNKITEDTHEVTCKCSEWTTY